MKPYSKDVELAMVTFFLSLREKDIRRYAAVEAAKLGVGGVPFVAKLLGIDPKTIRLRCFGGLVVAVRSAPVSPGDYAAAVV